MVSGLDLTDGVWWMILFECVGIGESAVVVISSLTGLFGSYSSSLESTFLKVR